MRRSFQLALATIALFPAVSFADRGADVAEISCDERGNALRIKTYVIWNEDYDAFIGQNSSGYVIGKERAIFAFGEIEGKVDYECRLEKSTFTVQVRGPWLTVLLRDGTMVYTYTDNPDAETFDSLIPPKEKFYVKIAGDTKVLKCVTGAQKKESCEPYNSK